MGERAGQPALRDGRLGERRRLHLERERARVPPHALAQRSGQRCQRRSSLPARRRDRPLLVPHAVARAGVDALRHAATDSATASSSTSAGRHPLGAVGVRGHGRAGQVLGAEGAKRIGPAAPALRDRLRRVGAGGSAREIGHACDHRDRPAERRALRAQPLQRGVRRSGRLLRRRRPDAQPSRGDRTEFLGRNGTLRNPAAMHRSRLSGKVGAALDPCAAIQVQLRSGGRAGARDRLPPRRRAQTPTTPASWCGASADRAAARGALEAVWQYWNHTLGAVQVETPDPSVNVLANGWLVYQTLACRIWARSGYYQSGGAFGFRDQLQDVMALIHAEPRLVREHLLLLREPPVPGGRCPALVASAVGPGRAHPLFGRLPLAAAGGVPLRAEHRRHRGAG